MVLFIAGLFMMFGADAMLRLISEKWKQRTANAN